MKFKTEIADELYHELKIDMEGHMDDLYANPEKLSNFDLFLAKTHMNEKIASIASHCANIDICYLGLKAAVTLEVNKGNK